MTSATPTTEPPATRFGGINQPLFTAARTHLPLVLVHRGSGGGSIAENTSKAVQAALTEGADIVEIDIIESTDGDYFCFHDGYEPLHFGIPQRLWEMTTAQIRELSYTWALSSPGAYPVTELGDMLDAFPHALFNIDRSWRWWPGLLDFMAERGNPAHLTLKSPVEEQHLTALAAHPTKYPYIPIVTSPEDVDRVLSPDVWEQVNLVGLELIARDTHSPFVDPGYLAGLRERGLLLMGNAINLDNGVPLYAGYDDETSMLDDPAHGWGVLVDKGLDIIQTDWPATLVRYLNSRGLRG